MSTAKRSLWVASALVLTLAPWSSAVIIRSATGTGNTTGTGAPGWDYVGSVGNGSVVYLGDGWAITAAHVNRSTPVTFAGTSYTTDQVVRLHEPSNTSAPVDIVMLHLTTSPSLASLSLSSSTPLAGTTVTMIGNGRDRASSLTYYSVNISTNPYTWTELASRTGSNFEGYKYLSTNTKRWGQNVITTTGQTINVGYGNTIVFQAAFDQNGGSGNNEAMVADGDSGGAAFSSTGALLGLLNAKSAFSGQPAETAIFGNLTNMVDLSAYRSQIVAAIPEPSAMLLVGSTFAWGLLRRRRCAAPTA